MGFQLVQYHTYGGGRWCLVLDEALLAACNFLQEIRLVMVREWRTEVQRRPCWASSPTFARSQSGSGIQNSLTRSKCGQQVFRSVDLVLS